jgi:hypothetical protein
LLTELLESERLVLYAGSSFDRGYELLDAGCAPFQMPTSVSTDPGGFPGDRP